MAGAEGLASTREGSITDIMEVTSKGFLRSSLMMPDTILLLSSPEPFGPATPQVFPGPSFSQQTLISISLV